VAQNGPGLKHLALVGASGTRRVHGDLAPCEDGLAPRAAHQAALPLRTELCKLHFQYWKGTPDMHMTDPGSRTWR